MNSDAHRKFLPTAEAAAYLGVRPSTLVRWRKHEHRGPAVVRLSANRAVYSVEELDRFAASRQETFEGQTTLVARP